MIRRLVVLTAALFAVPLAASASADTATFTATEDALVASSWPSVNYGSLNELMVNTSDPGSTRESYVKFDVRLPAGATITGAQLRLYATELHPTGTSVWRTSSSWSQSTLNWSNRPAATSSELYRDTGTTLGWRSLPLSASNVITGVQSFLLRGHGSGLSHYHSREHTNDPQLVVTYDAAPPPPPPPPSGLPRLSTSGRSITTVGGSSVMLRGVNTMRSEWDGSMAPERQSLPQLSSNWKGNVVVRGFAADPVNARSSTYLSWLDEYVSLGRMHRFYVSFVFRSYAQNGSQPASPDSRATSALTYLAQRYRAEPHVILGLQVEPHDVSWSSMRPVWESMIDSIRGPSGSNSATQPLVMVPGIRWGHDVSGAITNPVRRANVVYKVHPYGPQSYWYGDFGSAWDAGLPIFIGEFSLAPELDSTMTEVKALMAWARDHGVGWSAWVFDNCNCGVGQEGLFSSFATVAPTSPFGAAVRNEMLTTPPLPSS